MGFAASWEFDPSHTNAQFTVKHMMVTNVRGEFTKLTGAVELDEKDVTKSTVNASIDAASVNTREPKRDEHLRSADFFEVAKHPNLTFKSKKVEKGASANHLKVTGDLTIRGVTKEAVLEVELSGEAKDPWGNIRRGGVATTKVNRKDFGLVWNKTLETGGFLVGDDVNITIDFELTKKAMKKA
jgi:polyisoprenoid-binding protein YceI